MDLPLSPLGSPAPGPSARARASATPVKLGRLSETRKDRRKSLKFGEHLMSPETKEEKARVNGVLDVYQKVVQLCAENKVTTKNSWALNLIENIDTVLGAAKGSFHKASCALSAAVEIYGQRVDGTHADTFKMLETVLNSENRGEADGEDAREKRRKGAGEVQAQSTLESNLGNITSNKVDKEFDVDPLFRKILQGGNDGGSSGLLLNTLGVHRGCNMVFDTSGEAAFSSASAASSTAATDANGKPSATTYAMPKLDSRKATLCPSLAQLRAELARTTGAPSSKAAVPPVPVPAPVDDEEPVYANDDDMGGGYGDDDDDDDNDGMGGGGGGGGYNDDEDVRGVSSVAQAIVADIESRFLEMDGPFSATAYFDPKRAATTRGWAGPSHWKFAAPQRPALTAPAKTTAKSAAEKKPKRKLDFTYGAAPVASIFAPPPRSAASTLLTKKARESQEEHLLPIDVHFDGQDLYRLFSRPHTLVGPSGVVSAQPGQEDDGGDMGFDGDEAGEDEDDSAAYFDCDDDVDMAGLNLVAPAHHVERIRVAFATRAKRVDVKKLKSDLWEELQKHKDEEPSEETGGIALSDTIHHMKPSVNDNVTVPFYFICVLHLANEMGLELKSSEGLDDVICIL